MLKKKGGGKLSRSATVSVRLDPKLKHAADMAARYQRRTLSSLIEWAVEDSLARLEIKDSSNNNVNFMNVSEKTSDMNDSEKLVRIAIFFPSLLTYDELMAWKVIETHEYFWRTNEAYNNKSAGYAITDLALDNILEQWTNIVSLVDGGEDKIPSKPEDGATENPLIIKGVRSKKTK